jgi:NADH:ubiquinone oxidoreductase subunit K
MTDKELIRHAIILAVVLVLEAIWGYLFRKNKIPAGSTIGLLFIGVIMLLIAAHNKQKELTK